VNSHRQSRWTVLDSALLVATLLLAATALGGPRDDEGFIKVRIEAKAPGTGMEARAVATRNAQHAILAQILKTSLAIDDAPTIEPLLQRPERYIRSTQLACYEIVDGETRIQVESFVDRNQLLKDAAALILPRIQPPPKALVLVAQQVGANEPAVASSAATAESEIGKALEKASFEVVDTASVRACHTEAELLAAIKGDSQVAGSFAREGFADVVVLGEATVDAEPSAPGKMGRFPISGLRGGVDRTAGNREASQFFRRHGKVTVRVFRGRDGKCIDTLTREAVVHSAIPAEGATAALEDACAKLTEDMVMLCVMAVVGEQARDELVITLEEPGTRERLDAFAGVLVKATGSPTVDALLYSDRLARVRVRYAGSMVPLMDILTGNTYEGMALEIQKALKRDVTMRFVER